MIKTACDKQEKFNIRFLHKMRQMFDKNSIVTSILLLITSLMLLSSTFRKLDKTESSDLQESRDLQDLQESGMPRVLHFGTKNSKLKYS